MYNKATCPYCKTRNLVYLGDWESDTSLMVEATECCACGKYFLMGGELAQKEMLQEILINSAYVDVSESISVASALLRGEPPEAYDDEILDLSDFLRVYANTNKGEKCQ
jgi:Zn ribbon nucleic-acid-binding protein